MKTSVKFPFLAGKIQKRLSGESLTHLLTGASATGLFLITLFFGLYRLGVPGLWFDEAFSVQLARQPLPLLMHIIFGPEPNMELYYLLLHFWLSVTGWLGLPAVEFVVRLPSAIFAAMGIVLVFLLGKRFLGFGTGFLGALLFLVNTLQLTYAQQTRAYALQLLLLCAGWYALFSALTVEEKASARRWWCGYTLAMLLAIYTHLFSVLILFAQIMAVIGIVLLPNCWRDRVRARLVGLGLCIGLIGVGSLFLLPTILGGAKTGWLPVPQWHDFYHLFDTISGYRRSYLLVYTGLCAGSIGLLVLGWIFSSRLLAADKRPAWLNGIVRWLPSEQVWPLIWSLSCWMLLPILMSYAISQTSVRLFSARYLVTITTPFFLLIGFCITRIPWRNYTYSDSATLSGSRSSLCTYLLYQCADRGLEYCDALGTDSLSGG